jgi:hypothetical protein
MTRNEAVVALVNEWSATFLDKNADYGSSYLLTGQTLALWFPEGIVIDSPLKMIFVGLLTRMLDKLMRASNLVLRGKKEQVVDEKAYVTMGDLGNYGFMTAELLKNGVEK